MKVNNRWVKSRGICHYYMTEGQLVVSIAEPYPGEWKYSIGTDLYFHIMPNVKSIEEAKATAIALWRMQ